MAAFVSTFTDVGLVNTSANAGRITLPPVSQVPFRQLIFKDSFGGFSNRSLTLSTQTGDTFEDGTTLRVLRDNFGFQTIYGYNNVWYFLGGTQQASGTFSTLNVSSVNGGSAFTVAQVQSTVQGLGSAGYVSTASLISTTSFFQTAGFISSPNLLNLVSTQGLSTVLYSTITSLASFGYISTSQLTSTVAGLASASSSPPFLSAFTVSTGSLNASSINVLTANVSTTATISSLTVNSLQFGDGTGWVNIGPLQTIAISSIQENTNTLYANNVLLGSLSTHTDIQFFGLQGNFNNTVLAEVSTGAGTQELLMFKGSSSSDRIRMQTTGSIVFEPGVSSRLWNSNTIPTLSNATPAMVINTSSNVGIQTASPGATLDVAGTTRAITLSSQQLFVSSLNGAPLVGPTQIQSTITGLGSAGYVSSLSLLSTTLGLQQSGFLSSPNLLNLVSTQNLLGLVSSPNLLNLVSTPNLLNLVSTQGLSTVLYSTINSLGSFGYLSTSQLTSSLTGLGSLGYISSAQLISTSFGLNSNISTTFSSLLSGIPTTYGGEVLYMNYSVTVGSYKQLGIQPTTAALQTVPVAVTGGTTSNLASFQSDFQIPSFIPDGLWDFNVFAISNKTGTFLISELYTRSSGGVETLIASSSTNPMPIPTAAIGQLDMVVVVPYTPLSPGDTIVVKILGSNSPGASATITTYYEDGEYSHIHTTFGTLFPAGVLTSTVVGINNTMISTTRGTDNQLISTTFGLTNFISSFIDPTELASTVIGLGSAGFVSSLALDARLASTTTGLGTLGYISTSQLTSTTRGLGSSGYLSSFSSLSMSSATLSLSTLTFLDINTNSRQVLLVSSGTLTLNGNAVAGSGSASGMTISDYVAAGRLAADQNLTADIDNDIQFIDDFDPQNWWNPTTYRLAPTIAGYYLVSYQVWFNTGAVSTNQYNIQIQKNLADTFAISQLVQNTVTGTTLNATKIIYMNGSTDNLRFRAYVGSTSNTAAKAQFGTAQGSGTFFTAALLTNGSGGGNLISTTVGLGSIGYISTSQLVSTTRGIFTSGFLSSPNLLNLVSTQGLSTVLYSTITSLASFGYVSTSQLTSTTLGLQQSGFISSPNLLNLVSTTFLNTTLASSITGLGSVGYVSSASLSGLVSTPNLLNLVSTTFLNTTLASSITGLGSAGYVSTASLSGLVSTPNLLNLVSTTFLNTTLASSITGLGSAGYLSSINLLNLVSTTFLNTTLASSITGLATAGYISTSQLVSTVAGLGTVLTSLPSTISTFSLLTSSILASTITTRILSTQQIFTSSIFGNTSVFAALSSQSLFVSSFYTATRQATPMFVTF